MNDIAPGFADPAHDAQACFRGILTALSEPGRIVALSLTSPPAPLSHASAAILLTLTDPATLVSLHRGAESAWPWLGFHTGAVRAAAGDANFVLASERPPLIALNAGTDEEPERGATLILDLPRLGAGRRYRLSGPGIANEAILHAPLDADFAGEWRASRQRAPRGVDILLCAGTQVVGLPRSVAIEEL